MAAGIALLVSACAHAKTGDTRTPYGHKSLTLERGQAEDFRAVSAVCVTGQDVPAKRDMTAVITSALRERASQVSLDCREPFSGLRVEYQGTSSGCTHCPPSYKGPRFGFGFLWREISGTRRALAVWTDTYGGRPEEVALYFAADLVSFLADPEAALRAE